MSHDYRFGIEEEYFLADQKTGQSPSRSGAASFHKAAEKRLEVAEHELLVGQVEVSTKPGTYLDEALARLKHYRQELSELAVQHDLYLFAAGTHPLALADEQHVSSTDRYRRLGDELKLIAPKAAVSAMHVHVEVPDADKRVSLINRLMPFLPLLYALSVSSPFWEGRNSGLQGYRLTAFSQWPRVGLPGCFADSSQYARYIQRLTAAGFVEDASFVWSHIRPSVHYPTIEMRICDSCTKASDASAIAALYRALVRAVVRDHNINADFGPVEHALCGINLWRAQQAGVAASFVDSSSDRTLTLAEALQEALAITEEDFDALGMSDWRAHLKSIVTSGTSADRQLTIHNAVSSDHSGRAPFEVIRALHLETLQD